VRCVCCSGGASCIEPGEVATLAVGVRIIQPRKNRLLRTILHQVSSGFHESSKTGSSSSNFQSWNRSTSDRPAFHRSRQQIRGRGQSTKARGVLSCPPRARRRVHPTDLQQLSGIAGEHRHTSRVTRFSCFPAHLSSRSRRDIEYRGCGQYAGRKSSQHPYHTYGIRFCGAYLED
jgi:hypothetical protein